MDFGSGTVVTSAPAAGSTVAAAASTLFGFVDPYGATVKGRSIHAFDGLLSIVVALERHEAEAATAAGLAIKYHARFSHSTERFKGRLHGIVGRIPAEATYE